MGIGTAAGIGGIVAGAGSVAGGLTQAGAANNAAGLQAQEAQNALDFQKQQWQTQQENLQPWLKAGTQGVTLLSDLANPQSPSYLQPWNQTFQSPTAEQARETPGYQFAQQEGLNALQRSAAAKGDLLTGGTLKDITNYGQGLADTNYQQAYNNAFNNYTAQYNQYQQAQANQFNRTATQAGLGQTATGQLNQAAQQAASNVGNIDLTSGAQIGQNINNAGAATASGYVGATNSLNNAFGNYASYQLLKGLGVNPGATPTAGPPGFSTGPADFSGFLGDLQGPGN